MLIRTEFFRPKYSLVEKPGKLQWNFVGLVCLNVKLYMSDISRILLLESEVAYHISTYRHIWYDILPVDQSTVIEVPNGNGDMDFVGMNGTVLYTGDFRWGVGDAAQYSALYHSFSQTEFFNGLNDFTTLC
ncbi:uncharacterized protein LOC143230285 isoform X3 [Tachypleus tridentatus]|uniref:uncharacterized protein LOC143230285 isoform X3 n=1 Tax=Tachypleus tridentatus TaxID=6853 RepID=UPI003FD0BDA4